MNQLEFCQRDKEFVEYEVQDQKQYALIFGNVSEEDAWGEYSVAVSEHGEKLFVSTGDFAHGVISVVNESDLPPASAKSLNEHLSELMPSIRGNVRAFFNSSKWITSLARL